MGLTLELWLTNEDIWGQYWGEKCLKRTKSPVISPKICPKSLLSACSEHPKVLPWCLWCHFLLKLPVPCSVYTLFNPDFLITDVISSCVYTPTTAGSLITIIKHFVLQIELVATEKTSHHLFYGLLSELTINPHYLNIISTTTWV